MRPLKRWRISPAALLALPALCSVGPIFAQTAATAAAAPPDDTPSVRVGVAIFTDYTYTDEPTTTDADGNTIHPSAFNIGRAYINVIGNISHGVSFRLTPDISRLTTSTSGLGAGGSVATSLDGSLAFRLKYAFGQFNLDDRWSPGSWARLGVQQTPYIEWEEGIYRYRFQGQIFVDRENFLVSSDFGVSAHYNLPANFGDVHIGYYNGDTYAKAEPNDQKAIQARVSFRPAPATGVWKGLRLSAFYDADHYLRNDDRTRLVYAATFENRLVNAGFEHLDAADRPTAAVPKTEAAGYTIWATPKLPRGWELLLRHDALKPDKSVRAAKKRDIGGIARWFKNPQQSAITAALLLDYERVGYDSALGKPDEKRYAVHALFNY